MRLPLWMRVGRSSRRLVFTCIFKVELQDSLTIFLYQLPVLEGYLRVAALANVRDHLHRVPYDCNNLHINVVL